jgi:hypothetical protein
MKKDAEFVSSADIQAVDNTGKRVSSLFPNKAAKPLPQVFLYSPVFPTLNLGSPVPHRHNILYHQIRKGHLSPLFLVL